MDAMDRKIEKKGIPRKKIWAGAVALLLLVLAAKIMFGDKSSKLDVEEEKFTVATVIHDKYQDFISVNGTVEPIRTIYLDAVEAGRVEAILIEEGNRVKKGDVIILLSNYNLLLDIPGNEADVNRAINDLKTTRINL